MNEFAPYCCGAFFIDGAKTGDEMILERLDGTFGCVHSVVVGFDQLDVDIFLL